MFSSGFLAKTEFASIVFDRADDAMAARVSFESLSRNVELTWSLSSMGVRQFSGKIYDKRGTRARARD